MRKKTKKASGNAVGLGVTMVLFALVLAVLLISTLDLSRSTNEEGVAATRQAIERASVLCYATEGFYPPGLNYIQEKYGVQIDAKRFAVRYEIRAANVMPVIRVVARP